MAQFYGTIQGQRGKASRLGTKASGLVTEACSWQGKVVVTLAERDGVDYVVVRLAKHQGHGSSAILYDGPVAGATAVVPVALVA